MAPALSPAQWETGPLGRPLEGGHARPLTLPIGSRPGLPTGSPGGASGSLGSPAPGSSESLGLRSPARPSGLA